MTNVRSVDFFDPPSTMPGADLNEASSGQLLGAGMLAKGMRLFSFAGQVVPVDGLHVWPPCGGEVMVWPDGRFVFKPGEIEASLADRGDMGGALLMWWNQPVVVI